MGSVVRRVADLTFPLKDGIASKSSFFRQSLLLRRETIFLLLFGDELVRQARKGGNELHYNAYGIEE